MAFISFNTTLWGHRSITGSKVHAWGRWNVFLRSWNRLPQLLGSAFGMRIKTVWGSSYSRLPFRAFVVEHSRVSRWLRRILLKIRKLHPLLSQLVRRTVSLNQAQPENPLLPPMTPTFHLSQGPSTIHSISGLNSLRWQGQVDLAKEIT